MPEPASNVVVFGASGFVGSAVCRALEARGATVVKLPAPRLSEWKIDVDTRTRHREAAIAHVTTLLPEGCAVVNAAGVSDSALADHRVLNAANAVLPGVLAAASARVGARFVHVSSAAVQGRTRVLDERIATAAFSPYSRSKAEGESAALAGNPRTVCYRPPGVHSPDRAVTRSIARVARSRLSTVAAPGTANTAQALLENVADAVAYLATTPHDPPAVVSHPAEGLTTASLLRLLGKREPRRVPRPLARAVVGMASAGGRISARVAATARRLEMLWFGQDQAPGWLTTTDWAAPVGEERWAEIGRLLQRGHVQEEKQ